MSSRLALHCHRSGADVDAAIRAASWQAVKALNDTAPLATAHSAGIPVRIFRDTRTDAAGSTDAANLLLAHDLSHTTHLQITCETARGYDPVWQTGVHDTLRLGGYAGMVLVCAFPTGNPTSYDRTTHADGTEHFPDLVPLVPLLSRPDVALALDAYTGILRTDPRWAAWAPWTCQRHRMLRHCLHLHGADPDVVVTESGGDDVQPAELKQGGWLGRGWSAADYLATLTALDADDQADGVLARCIFTLGGTPDWQLYEIGSIVPALAAYVTSQANGVVMTTGIDVSSAQPGTDWQQVAANGKQFAFVKATEGVGYTSPTFAADWSGIAAAGLVRGAYHYARPDLSNDPAAEARAFLTAVGPLATGDLLALDIEVGSGDLGAWAAAWFAVVDAALGVPALLYSYGPFIEAHGLTMAAVGKRPLWLAAYQSGQPSPPLDWPALTIWQVSDRASVPGITGPCDADQTPYTLDLLRALGRPAVPGPTGVEAEALAYFQQRGISIARDHAIWTVTLLPMYVRWKALAAAGDPLADAYHLGPALEPEYATTFGGTQPAGAIRLTNARLGAYLTPAGTWRAYALEL